jgi:hypothetical protein
MGLLSLQLDSDDYLYVNHCTAYAFGTSDFTVEAWIKTLTGGSIVGKRGSGGSSVSGGFLLVARSDGTIRFTTDNGRGGEYGFSSAPSSVCDGVWHHVAAVRHGEQIVVYLDGAPATGSYFVVGDYDGTLTAPLDVTNTNRLTLGVSDRPEEPHRSFSGAMAEVRVWSSARSAVDIAVKSQSRLLPETAGLVGYWPMEMGLQLDLSPVRNGTSSNGSPAALVDGPPVRCEQSSVMTFLYSGNYDTAVRSGCSSSSTWTGAGSLCLTSAGHLIQDDQVLAGVVSSGGSLSWPQEGNPSAGSITFGLSNEDAAIWPDGPQGKCNFQGWCQTSGGAAANYRGVIAPRRLGHGVILHIGSGKVLSRPSATAGTPVTLAAKTAQTDEEYCFYDDTHLLQTASGLAFSVQGTIAADAAIVLDSVEAGQSRQQWSLGTDGLIRPAGNPALAVTIDPTHTPNRLRLATASATDPNQQFLTLANARFIWNGLEPNVLTAAGAGLDQATTAAKADGLPAQLWYCVRSSLINAANGLALTVNGMATSGAELAMATANPADAAQQFTLSQGQLRHVASDLAVRMSTPGGVLTLGTARVTDTGFIWRASQSSDATALATLVDVATKPPNLARRNITYFITIWTGGSGTGDRVEVALYGSKGHTSLVELTVSETHPTPFQKHQGDRFRVDLPDVGVCTSIQFRYGHNHWFFSDTWEVTKISVFDASAEKNYHAVIGLGWIDYSGGVVFAKARDYEMPSHADLPLRTISADAPLVNLVVSKAPTRMRSPPAPWTTPGSRWRTPTSTAPGATGVLAQSRGSSPADVSPTTRSGWPLGIRSTRSTRSRTSMDIMTSRARRPAGCGPPAGAAGPASATRSPTGCSTFAVRPGLLTTPRPLRTAMA